MRLAGQAEIGASGHLDARNGLDYKSIARNSERSATAPGRDQPAVHILDAERGQDSAMIGAGVDPDPVAPLVHLRDDRVAVDDDEAMLLRVAEKRLADPPQIVRILVLDGEAGADAGMDE